MNETYRVDGLQVVRSGPPPGKPLAGPPPLLLVPGASHGAWCWELWQEKLPELGWESHALSLRNHPDSYPVEEETFRTKLKVTDYADDVAAVANQLPAPCVVVGHSMGGMVAQSFVAQSFVAQSFRNQRRDSAPPVAGLVLLASTAPAQLGPAIATPFPTDQPILFDRETTTQRYFHTTPPERLERALNRLVPESTAVINEILAPPGVSIESSRITCPVLSVTAGFDGTSVPKDGALAEYYGGEHIHDAENGHDLMLEAGWEALLERILDWVTRRVAKL